jgi:hypothetical protein
LNSTEKLLPWLKSRASKISLLDCLLKVFHCSVKHFLAGLGKSNTFSINGILNSLAIGIFIKKLKGVKVASSSPMQTVALERRSLEIPSRWIVNY